MNLRWYQHEAVEAMLTAKDNRVVVAPTGSGKTRIISSFLQQFEGNVIVLSHVKEILEQNFHDLIAAGLSEVGLWSAGLGIKARQRITVAGIQSIYRETEHFKDTDLIVIDECHLVNHDNVGMYRQLVNSLGVQVIGLTATPFRLKHGYIWNDGGLFDGPCYDITSSIPRLVDEGFLSPLTTQLPEVYFEMDGISTVSGDYSQRDMDEQLVLEDATELIVKALVPVLQKRKHVVIFAINIRHAEMIHKFLIDNGIGSKTVHSRMTDAERDEIIHRFKIKDLHVIINVGILTIGFDAPHIDLIALLRPTQSAALYAQMVGRGLRVAPGKKDCLVLDYGTNIERHGFIDNLNIDKKGKPKGKKGPAPVKPCPECGTYMHLRSRHCENCGYTFPEKNKLTLVAFNADIATKKVNWHKVTKVNLTVHLKAGSPPSVKVSYVCGLRWFHEWICLEHPGRVGQTGRRKIANRWVNDNPPSTAAEACRRANEFKWPTRIEVTEVKKYPEILQMDYSEKSG